MTDWKKRAQELWEQAEAFEMGYETPCMFLPLTPRKNGYVRVSAGRGNDKYAHRLMYETFVGPIPDGLDLDHRCRQRACANFEHARPATNRANVLAGVGITAVLAKRDRCANDHVFDEANTRWEGNRRRCRACSREGWRRRHGRVLS